MIPEIHRRCANDVVTAHVKYGDQGITIHGWIINIIIKGEAKSGRFFDSLNSPLLILFFYPLSFKKEGKEMEQILELQFALGTDDKDFSPALEKRQSHKV